MILYKLYFLCMWVGVAMRARIGSPVLGPQNMSEVGPLRIEFVGWFF